MSIWKWLNPKRLRDYPRLVFIASWAVISLNIFLSHGWVGGLTGLLMWGDFIDYYAAGKIYISNISHLYDPSIQERTQLSLIAPTQPNGFTFYSYPPNAALVHSALSWVPLPVAAAVWSVLSIGCVIFSAYLIYRYLLPQQVKEQGMTTFQLSILLLSSFTFTEGFSAGQTHSLTMLLIIAMLITTQQKKWVLAGVLAALSTYKPQYAIGFLVLWLIWGKYKAIISFVLCFSLWHGIVLITKGISPYVAYLSFSNQLMYLSYVKKGFPTSIMATPFAMVASFLPIQLASFWIKAFFVIGAILIILFARYIYVRRNLPMEEQNIILAMAIIVPLLISPYVLLHDLLILAAVLVLMTNVFDHVIIKSVTLGVYLAVLFIPLIGYVTKTAPAALIPVSLFIVCLWKSSRLSDGRITGKNSGAGILIN